MPRHAASIALVVLACCVTAASSAVPARRPAQRPAPTPRAAHLLLDVQTGQPLSLERADIIRTPVLPGSIAKIATLLAALESGAIRPDTAIVCRRRIAADGRTYTCAHPPIAHPLTPADALAHSCNYYFVSIAPRIRRDVFDRALTSMGLPPSDPAVPMSRAALGLAGMRASPEQMLKGFVRLVTAHAAGMDPAWREALFQGLQGAANHGTAAALGQAGISAHAKTGTSPMPGGGFQGLVVATTPADRPTRAVVVLAPGAAGADAAAIAASVLSTAANRDGSRPRAQTLRVGRIERDGRVRVEELDLEDYVARAVAGEASPGGSPEARKALAIAVRSYAWSNRGRHSHEGFDLCDLTHCQALRDPAHEHVAAAAATRGRVLDYKGKPASVFYSASCGGRTERPSRVWPGAEDPPYLAERADEECKSHTWSRELAADDLVRALRQAGFRGHLLRNLQVTARTGSGRVARLRVEGFEPAEIGGDAFRLAVGRALGWQHLKSALFEVTRTARGYRFDGRGAGHGVGLCVTGSEAMARRGASAADILQAYFPGTRIRGAAAGAHTTALQTVDPVITTRIEVVLPAGEERAHPEVRDIAASALRAIVRRSGLPFPASVRITVHPSVKAYMAATGLPWWTAGAARGTEIHLIPIDSLRRNGTLAKTIAHELAHVVIGERLAGQPLWAVEGAAMYLSGEVRMPGAPAAGGVGGTRSARCPSDEELSRATTKAALGRAYTAAAACFAERGEDVLRKLAPQPPQDRNAAAR